MAFKIDLITEERKTVGYFLMRRRRSYNMTQADVGHCINRDRATISHMENGYLKDPTLYHEYAEFLNIDLYASTVTVFTLKDKPHELSK